MRIREDAERYGGLLGEIIHRERISGSPVYRREHPDIKAGEGRLALVVELVDPPPGFEPVILCYEDQISQVSAT